jgi:hypothetical protein
MTNTELINRTKEIAQELVNGKDLDQRLWDLGFQTSQGAWNSDYLIRKGKFTQEAVDIVEEQDDLREELFFMYDELVYNNAEQMAIDPEKFGYSKSDIEEMSEDEIFECACQDCGDWVYPAFQNFITFCVQKVLDENN